MSGEETAVVEDRGENITIDAPVETMHLNKRRISVEIPDEVTQFVCDVCVISNVSIDSSDAAGAVGSRDVVRVGAGS